jgi:hypothetical protein
VSRRVVTSWWPANGRRGFEGGAGAGRAAAPRFSRVASNRELGPHCLTGSARQRRAQKSGRGRGGSAIVARGRERSTGGVMPAWAQASARWWRKIRSYSGASSVGLSSPSHQNQSEPSASSSEGGSTGPGIAFRTWVSRSHAAVFSVADRSRTGRESSRMSRGGGRASQSSSCRGWRRARAALGLEETRKSYRRAQRATEFLAVGRCDSGILRQRGGTLSGRRIRSRARRPRRPEAVSQADRSDVAVDSVATARGPPRSVERGAGNAVDARRFIDFARGCLIGLLAPCS